MPRETKVDERQVQQLRDHNLGKLLVCCLTAFEMEVLGHMEARGYALESVYLPIVRNLDLSGSSITELAARARLSKQTVGPLVRDLEQRGIVSISVDPKDRRARVVRFTRRGRNGLDAGLEGIRTVTRRYSRALGSARMKLLMEMLEDLLEVVGPPEPVGHPKSARRTPPSGA